MSQSTLKHLRFITPGVIFILFVGLLGSITGLWPMVRTENLKDWIYSITVIVPAGLYYLSPLRGWANEQYFDDVTENLRSGLVRISGLPDNRKLFTWQFVRGIFFHFVDLDKSLSAKASLAYFNGFIWTTLADVRAIAISFMLPSALLCFFGDDQALLALSSFGAIALLSFPLSRAATKRHQDIGNEQLEIIDLKYQCELAKMIGAARDRADAGSN